MEAMTEAPSGVGWMKSMKIRSRESLSIAFQRRRLSESKGMMGTDSDFATDRITESR